MDKEFAQYEFQRSVTLAGGFTAALTNSERNEWHEHCAGSPLYRKFRAGEDVLASQLIVAGGGRGSDPASLSHSMADSHALSQRMFELGKAWYGELEGRRQQMIEAQAGIEMDTSDRETKS